jgi:hypothetical protein
MSQPCSLTRLQAALTVACGKRPGLQHTHSRSYCGVSSVSRQTWQPSRHSVVELPEAAVQVEDWREPNALLCTTVCCGKPSALVGPRQQVEMSSSNSLLAIKHWVRFEDTCIALWSYAIAVGWVNRQGCGSAARHVAMSSHSSFQHYGTQPKEAPRRRTCTTIPATTVCYVKEAAGYGPLPGLPASSA